MPKTAHRVVAGDRVEPRAELVGIAQTSEVCRGNTEGVLHAVGCSVTVPEKSDTEVIQPVGIAVINLGERLTVTVGRRASQIAVADAGLKLQCFGHHEPPEADASFDAS